MSASPAPRLDATIAKAVSEWAEMPWHGGIPVSTQEGALVGMIREALLAEGDVGTHFDISGPLVLVLDLESES